MSTTTIYPTKDKPLFIATKNSRSQLRLKKIWVEVPNNQPAYRVEEIWCATCQFSKNHSLIEINQRWENAKRLTPANTTLCLIQYDAKNNVYDIPHILKISDTKLPQHLRQPKSEYLEFALNPLHLFSPSQLKSVWQQLRSWMSTEQIAQFLTMWPDVDKEEVMAAAMAAEHRGSPYPCTVEQALEVMRPLEEAEEGPVRCGAPTLLPTHQPTTTPTLIPNLISTNHHAPNRKQPVGDAEVVLKIVPAGKQNRRREVFYATPTTPPTDPFPISPLKANIAILYADINPNSPTFNQPIIKSICFSTSTDEEIEKFYNQHKANMSPDQLSLHPSSSSSSHPTATTPTATTPTANQQTQAKGTTMHCKFCNNEFEQKHGSSLYCSPKCRIDYNAGRSYGGEGEQRATAGSAATERPPTAGEFRALSAKVDQLLYLLTPKE